MNQRIGSDPLASLVQAIIFGNTEGALRLIRAGAPVDGVQARSLHGITYSSTPLMSAVLMRNMAVLEALLDAGANPDQGLPDTGRTPLDQASRAGDEAIVRALLEKGARWDQPIRLRQWPILHCAAEGGNLDIVRLFIEGGADVFARDDSGRTALDVAIHHRREWVAVYLRERMAASGRPIGLQEAAADGQMERVSELLDQGTPVDEREPARQRTALHLAVLRERLKVAGLLIERGADPNARDALGHSCLTLYTGFASVRILKLLLQAGADPNAGGPDGLTPLLWHVRERSGLKTLRILLEAGADVAARAPDGKSALELAPTDMPGVRRYLKDLLGIEPDEADQLRDQIGKFPELAQDPKFQALAARLGSLFGRKPAPWKSAKGGIYFHGVSLQKYRERPDRQTALPPGFAGDQTLRLFVALQDEVRGVGFTLVHTDSKPAGGRASIVLLPTGNQYAALLARGTNGANHGHGTRAIIAWLLEMENTNPFILTGCGSDFLLGRFLGTVRQADEWAEKMVAFCPDLDDGTPDAVRRLAVELEQSGWFAFWWD